MTERGLSERHALRVTVMSASTLRYRPAPDRNGALRERIRTLAHRHRRYGAGMIYLKLRQAGEIVNHKRVDRLYAEEKLQLKRRQRKKVPVADRQPLERPEAANEVWSMDFVFDRSADGRVIKCLTIVGDATHESVATVPERAVGGQAVTRVLDRLTMTRGLPRIIRTDNGKEFCGHAMLTWAHAHNVTLRLIEPGKPNQNAYIESVQRSIPGRVPQRALVPESQACPGDHRGLAAGIQRGATEEGIGWPDTGCLCEAAGRKISYSDNRALNGAATQGGGTSAGTSGYCARRWRIVCRLMSCGVASRWAFRIRTNASSRPNCRIIDLILREMRNSYIDFSRYERLRTD
jgi:transposase InsO family protein